MRGLAQICLLFVSLLYIIRIDAQTTFPLFDGDRIYYTASVELPNAYVSGVCILLQEKKVIKGSLINEFGITALDFTFNPARRKVKLHNVIKMMDKWYIRQVLRNDIARLMTCLQKGETRYRNKHRNITYLFTPISDEVTQ